MCSLQTCSYSCSELRIGPSFLERCACLCSILFAWMRCPASAIRMITKTLTSIEGNGLNLVGERFLFVVSCKDDRALHFTAIAPYLSNRLALIAVMAAPCFG